jgi:hypothetical protein
MTCCYPDIKNRCFRHTKLDSLAKVEEPTSLVALTGSSEVNMLVEIKEVPDMFP